jgi:hypothetical protein
MDAPAAAGEYHDGVGDALGLGDGAGPGNGAQAPDQTMAPVVCEVGPLLGHGAAFSVRSFWIDSI